MGDISPWLESENLGLNWVRNTSDTRRRRNLWARIFPANSRYIRTSVADPGSECFPSWIRIFPSRITDPGYQSNNLSILTQKIGVSKLSEIWSRFIILDPDPGSWSCFFTHPGSRIQGSKRHQILDPDPQHWSEHMVIRTKSLYIGLNTSPDPGSGCDPDSKSQNAPFLQKSIKNRHWFCIILASLLFKRVTVPAELFFSEKNQSRRWKNFENNVLVDFLS